MLIILFKFNIKLKMYEFEKFSQNNINRNKYDSNIPSNIGNNPYDNDPLNNPEINIKDHFKNFIRNKNIEELIAYDNKLFSEVRNLESEKHILVTQNYKKFVAATETINTVRKNNNLKLKLIK